MEESENNGSFSPENVKYPSTPGDFYSSPGFQPLQKILLFAGAWRRGWKAREERCSRVCYIITRDEMQHGGKNCKNSLLFCFETSLKKTKCWWYGSVPLAGTGFSLSSLLTSISSGLLYIAQRVYKEWFDVLKGHYQPEARAPWINGQVSEPGQEINTQEKSRIFCRVRKERAKNKQDGGAAKEEEANFGREV